MGLPKSRPSTSIWKAWQRMRSTLEYVCSVRLTTGVMRRFGSWWTSGCFTTLLPVPGSPTRTQSPPCWQWTRSVSRISAWWGRSATESSANGWRSRPKCARITTHLQGGCYGRGGSQLLEWIYVTTQEEATCLLSMAPTEIEQPAASKRCRGPRPGQPAASERARGPRPGQLATSKRCRGPKASSWLPPVRASEPRRRNRLPSARSSERAAKQPEATWRASRSAWRKTATRQPSQRATSVHAEGSARSDDKVLGQRAAIAQPSRCGKRSHARKIDADVEMAAVLARLLGARVAPSRGAARARTTHTSQGAPDVEQRCHHQSQLPRRPLVDGRRTSRRSRRKTFFRSTSISRAQRQ